MAARRTYIRNLQPASKLLQQRPSLFQPLINILQFQKLLQQQSKQFLLFFPLREHHSLRLEQRHATKQAVIHRSIKVLEAMGKQSQGIGVLPRSSVQNHHFWDEDVAELRIRVGNTLQDSSGRKCEARAAEEVKKPDTGAPPSGGVRGGRVGDDEVAVGRFGGV